MIAFLVAIALLTHDLRATRTVGSQERTRRPRVTVDDAFYRSQQFR